MRHIAGNELLIIGGFLNMSTLEYIIGGLLGVLGITLVVIIMAQQSIRRGLSGTISGGASESYFGKNRRKTKAKILNKVTAILGTVLGVLVLTLYVVHTVTVNKKNADESAAAASEAAAQSQTAVNTSSSANSLYDTSK
jgi:preprotein translocase subunit SecG